MSVATPQDVRDLIDTDLSDTEIQAYIDDAAIENELVNDVSEQSTELTRMIEERYAAYLIRAVRERSKSSLSQESASLEYDGVPLEELRRLVARVDPSGELTGITTDSNRTITATDMEDKNGD